jgi:BNR repeat-containing family member
VSRALVLAAALAALAAPARAGVHDLGAGSWSYFGDPRAIGHDGRTFTGWIATGGDVVVAELGPGGAPLARRTLFRGLGADDHGNPSLVARPDGRLAVFFAPHSGRTLPPGGRPSLMRYRVGTRPWSIARWGPVRTVPTNAPGRLGFTYPNPVQQRDRLWLFWRGGGWNPTYAITVDGRTWTRARELVRGPRGQRPYAKYEGGGDGTIHAAISGGHPAEGRSGLFYAAIRDRALYAADGRRIARLAAPPPPVTALQPIRRRGRAWPHDIALGAHGRPVVVYTLRHGGPHGTDVFTYATADARGHWTSRRIVSAGRGYRTYTSGGATLHHGDPRLVLLSRTIGAHNQVEAWFTPDRGRTWSHGRLTASPDRWSIRPVIPRGLDRVVLFVRGDERTRSYADPHTRIVALTAGAAAGAPA